MSTSLPAPSAPIAEAQPMEGGERLALLDALRGFALCGVFVSNVFGWFSGRVFLPRAQLEALAANASLLDTVTSYATRFLVSGKFITIFSFLFGLGFAVQMGRAEQRGASIVPLYARRLGVLLVIGLTHLFLLWFGDILTEYALLGFGLLLFRNRQDKTLLIWAALLIFGAPLVIILVQRFPQLLGSAEAMAAAKAEMERSAAHKAEALATFSSGSYLEVVGFAAGYYVKEFLTSQLAFSLPLFGRFLLGLMAGRRGLFHTASQYLPLFRKVLIGGLVLGALGSGAGVVLQQLFLRKVLTPETMPWLPFVTSPIRQLGELGLASFYVAGFTLLFQRSTWQRLLSVLAPVGRMALTHYLTQSVVSLLFFYGYGLGFMARLGPAQCLAYALAVFSVQVVLSHLWLARFRFGPAEWVWRSLTYGKAQPMRRAPTPEVASPAA